MRLFSTSGPSTSTVLPAGSAAFNGSQNERADELGLDSVSARTARHCRRSGWAMESPAFNRCPPGKPALCVGQPISVIHIGFSASPYSDIRRRSPSSLSIIIPSGFGMYGWTFITSKNALPPSAYTRRMKFSGTPQVPPKATRICGSTDLTASYVTFSSLK